MTENNTKVLRAFIKDALIGKSLTVNEIYDEVVRLGYKFKGEHFIPSLRKKIRMMLFSGELEKLSRGDVVTYRLTEQVAKAEPLDVDTLVRIHKLVLKVGLENVQEIVENPDKVRTALAALKLVSAI